MGEKKTTPDKISAKTYTTEILDRSWISKTAFEIELARPFFFDFIPGQCICFIHDDIERYYSLISTPDNPTLRLCVHYVKQGIFSPLLSEAKMGTRFTIKGPRGYFTFRASARPPVFVACGTGIAPFLSIGRSGVTGFTLLHEVKEPKELYYESFFRSSAKRYVPCLTEDITGTRVPPNAFFGEAAEYLAKHLAPLGYDFYLCGEREMIRDVTLCVDEDFPESFVYQEVYY